MRALSIVLFFLVLTGLPNAIAEAAWTRHVLTERADANRTLLLVIDVPQDRQELQNVVFRKSFTRDQQSELQRYKLQFENSKAASYVATPKLAAAQDVWSVTKAWTEEDEADYALWIEKYAGAQFLKGSGLEVDCADYAMTLRWIYAHDHGLPAANTLAASQILFGSWTSSAKWDALATDPDWRKDLRFKAALRYVLANTYTHSLQGDLYPVAITQEYVRPGAIYLTMFRSSGHTRTIFKIGNGGACLPKEPCISILYGDEPASELGYTSTLVPWRVNQGEGGFMRFRWPENAGGGWQLRAIADMPGFSLEQFQWDDHEYSKHITDRLGLFTSPEQSYVSFGGTVVEMFAQRKAVVERGYFLCSLIPCEENDATYDQWSTPQRDHSLASAVTTFQEIGTRVVWNNEAVDNFQTQQDHEFYLGSAFTTLDLLYANNLDSLSSDPRADFFIRWGTYNPKPIDIVSAWSEVAFDNWSWRESLVTQAQVLCFATDATTVTCDPGDPKIQALETSRLDQAFRVFLARFKTAYGNLASFEQTKINNWLKSKFTDVTHCPANAESRCSMQDLLLNQPELINKMSSRPQDPPAARYGF